MPEPPRFFVRQCELEGDYWVHDRTRPRGHTALEWSKMRWIADDLAGLLNWLAAAGDPRLARTITAADLSEWSILRPLLREYTLATNHTANPWRPPGQAWPPLACETPLPKEA